MSQDARQALSLSCVTILNQFSMFTFANYDPHVDPEPTRCEPVRRETFTKAGTIPINFCFLNLKLVMVAHKMLTGAI